MLPSSLPIILATVALTAGAAIMLAVVWKLGFLREWDAQARSIFDERDFRLAREWEGPVDALERELQYGPPVAPRPGEWGGAAGGVRDTPARHAAPHDDDPSHDAATSRPAA